MRQFLYCVAAAGLCGLLGSHGLAGGKASLPPTGKTDVKKVTEGEACGSFGTSVEFVSTPSAAAKQADKEQKLVFVLHVSGNFEDPTFTWNNAEALRVNALADPKVGAYINKYFVSSFQRVGTFKIVGKAKQGGNVAAYFCAPDGRVLHCVAGPVNSQQMLKEATWVVDTVYAAMKEAEGDGNKFKAIWRTAHAQKLKNQYGINVEPVKFEVVVAQDPNSALTYKDPTGKPIAPKLPPPPINGPNVHFDLAQKAEAAAPGAKAMMFKGGGGHLVLGNQGQVHVLMTAHSLKKIEDLYGAVFQGILGEQISTQPVQVVTPFPWMNNKQK